jgi:hypothetical protein
MSPRSRLLAVLAATVVLSLPACQQKMADQPYFRPLEETEFYPDGRSARPIEPGTVFRGQAYIYDPLRTGLSVEGRKIKVKHLAEGTIDVAGGAPDDPKNYVSDFPFEMTGEDLRRGMQRYTIFCTPCHGAAGDGKGKIWERGYLKPTSFHPDFGFKERMKDNEEYKDSLPPGYSRGFGRYRIELPMTEVPVGYYFEVVANGFGGMPEHLSQIDNLEDIWRIIAYVRVLQLSQSSDLKELPDSVKDAARKELEGKKRE